MGTKSFEGREEKKQIPATYYDFGYYAKLREEEFAKDKLQSNFYKGRALEAVEAYEEYRKEGEELRW